LNETLHSKIYYYKQP